MEKYFIEKKFYEIKNESSFHEIRLNDVINNINKYNDVLANEIKVKLNKAKNIQLNNTIEKEVEKVVEKENKKYIEKMSLKCYDSKISFSLTCVKNNVLALCMCYNGEMLAVRQFDDIYAHIYIPRLKTTTDDSIQQYVNTKNCNAIKLYKDSNNLSEIPYLYLDKNVKKKYILFFSKNINDLNIMDKNKIHPITNIPISLIENYEIKYELNILKYLLVNKNKLKYLVYYIIFYFSKNQHSYCNNIVADIILSLYNFKSKEFIDDNITSFLQVFLKIFELDKTSNKKYFIYQMELFYKIILHCSLHKRIIAKGKECVDKILLTYSKNKYYDTQVKHIETNDEICLDIALYLYKDLDINIKKIIHNILNIPENDEVLIKRHLYRIVFF